MPTFQLMAREDPLNGRVRAIVVRAYRQTNVATAGRLLQDLARRLADRYPSAAASVREGLEETLTVLTLGLSDRLRQSLATTNAIESVISRSRRVKRNVKRWRGGQMVLRWTAAAVLEAEKGFRRLKDRADMPKLVAALRARDQELGFISRDGVEEVARTGILYPSPEGDRCSWSLLCGRGFRTWSPKAELSKNNVNGAAAEFQQSAGQPPTQVFCVLVDFSVDLLTRKAIGCGR
jgi:hypothetical protein